jgi:hypothetical protein
MAHHKFRIGQLVQLAPAIARNAPAGTYEVTKQLPESHGEFEYRIKNVSEPHERIARESELRADYLAGRPAGAVVILQRPEPSVTVEALSLIVDPA